MVDNSEILRNKLERIRSIEFQINKGLTNDFTYGVRLKESAKNELDTSLFVEKSGEEIKQALGKDKLLCNEQVALLISTMADKVKEIEVQPSGSYRDSDDWLVKDWIGKIELPMKYQYDQIYQSDVMNQNTTNKKMLEYNECSRKLICLNIEQKKLQTIINTLNDKKTYKLTIDIASKLGF